MEWLEWIGNLPHAVALRRNVTLYVLTNAAHILGIGLLLGAILPLDLKVMGALKRGPLSVLAPFLVKIAATGLALAIVTGFCLFSVKPQEYIGNPAFLAKIGLIALGLVNIPIQHRNLDWIHADEPPPLSARISALVSFSIWIAVMLAGRSIGFL